MATTPKVLIVDDEEQFCASILKILTARKISARAVHSGADALAELFRNPYDVILLDVKMPGISGIEVLKQLRDKDIQAEVIVLSGHASLDTAVEIVQYGAYDYLLKPCDVDDLIVKIINAYEQRLEKQKLR